MASYTVSYKFHKFQANQIALKNSLVSDYIISKKRLSEREARSIFKQIIAAVHHCHSNHIVHRDIKVENILLDYNGNVKLADFGFSNFYMEGELMDTWCGSPQYCAPGKLLISFFDSLRANN